MKKASLILLLLVFLFGMGVQYLFSNLSNLFSEDEDQKVVMVDEENSSTTFSKETCLRDFYVVDRDVEFDAEESDVNELLTQIVTTLNSNRSTLIIKHDGFNIEYVVVKDIDNEIITYVNKRKDWLDYKKKHDLYTFQTICPIIYKTVEPVIFTYFCNRLDTSTIACVEAKARAPGNEIPYGRMYPEVN